MSERNAEEVRQEIAAERQRLDNDLTALQSDLRSVGLLAGAALAVVALVTWRKGARNGVVAVWKLVR